jgi:hypothetical protein
MKHFVCTLFIVLITQIAYAQTDTIFSIGEKVSCIVKEITNDEIKYSYINEDLILSLNKNLVQKIVFKSGRIQEFTNTKLKQVLSAKEFENVLVTYLEGDIKNLQMIDEVSGKAKGTTIYSSKEKVRERAFRKMKIQAAFMGANIVFVTNQNGKGNVYFGNGGNSAETDVQGNAYRSIPLNIETFKSTFPTTEKYFIHRKNKLWKSDFDMTGSEAGNGLNIESVFLENGLLYIKAKINNFDEQEKYLVANFDDTSFQLYFKDGNTVFNLEILKKTDKDN